MKLSIQRDSLALSQVFETAGQRVLAREVAFVRIDHEDLTGWGEATYNPRFVPDLDAVIAVLEAAAPAIESADPWRYRDVVRQVGDAAPGAGMPGRAAEVAARAAAAAAQAAIDMALLDWVSRSAEVSLGQYLGLGGHGADGDASAGDDSDEPPVTSVSIGHGAPADMAAQVTAHIESRRAFARFKIKVGASADADQAGLDAIRAVTDRPLVADANGGFADREDAARRIEVLAARGVEWIEQPLSAGRLEDVAWLRRRTPIPILADEDVLTAADVVRAAAAYDGVNIKLMKAGGVTAALAQVEIARACGLRVLLGCAMQSSLAATAAAHLAPLFDWIDLDAPLFLARDPFEGLDYGPGGRLLLPGRPGIGARRRG